MGNSNPNNLEFEDDDFELKLNFEDFDDTLFTNPEEVLTKTLNLDDNEFTFDLKFEDSETPETDKNKFDKFISEEEIKLFLSKLGKQERIVIKKQIKKGIIDDDDYSIIENSKYDINGFLSKCEDLSKIKHLLDLIAMKDMISVINRDVHDILNR